jgi:hypothetical protein
MKMETFRVNVAPNKWREAEEWQKKVTAYVKKAGWQTSLLQQRTGDVFSFVSLTQHSSIAEADAALEKILADSEFMKIWREGQTADWFLGAQRTYWDVLIE